MDTDTCNAIEITEVIRTAIASDAVLSPQMAKIDVMIVASADKEIDTTDDETANKLQCGGRILLVQLWPQSSRLSLVAVRLLNHHNLGMPWSGTKAEYAIDWASELSLSGAEPLFAHIVLPDEDAPVFFNHTVIGHTGRNIDYFDLNVQDLRERFPRAMERIADRMMFLVNILPTPALRQEGRV